MSAARKVPLDERIDRLRKAAANVANATNPRQRDAAMTFLTRRAVELTRERDRLAAKLDAGWDTLDALKADGEKGTPEYEKHHARYLGWIAEYERVCDALDEAARGWLRPAPAMGATA